MSKFSEMGNKVNSQNSTGYRVTTKECNVVYLYYNRFEDVAVIFLSIFNMNLRASSFKFKDGCNGNIGYAIHTNLTNAVLYHITFFGGPSIAVSI